MRKKQPDVLVFMSDQHTPYFSGWLGHNVDTPNLDALCAAGTRFDEAYTACPLCVPARMAMLSTKMPHQTGVYTNMDALSDLEPTFLHPLVAAGYETVLCGRMHFLGTDQRHGFTKRIAPDTTQVGWRRPLQALRRERGAFVPAYAESGAVKFAGGGESPVVNYDAMVVEAALAYLAQEHEKPQFLLVGTYGPHFPYVAPVELYQKYLCRVSMPRLYQNFPAYLNELLAERRRPEVGPEKLRAILAAYSGQVERMDGQIGAVRAAFEKYAQRRGGGIFCYLSDHGDQLGDRDLYGKQTFFEKSVKIPLIFAGRGIAAGNVVRDPVSILDLGPTLWELLGADGMAESEGVSLAPCLRGGSGAPERTVFSEMLYDCAQKGDRARGTLKQDYAYALMIRRGRYKYLYYHGYNEMLFDLERDPLEQYDLTAELPRLAKELREMALGYADAEVIKRTQRRHDRNVGWYRQWEEASGFEERERWTENPPEARALPRICVE